MNEHKTPLRPVREPFVVQEATGVAIRDRLAGLTPQDDEVLRLVGGHLGSLAATDLGRYSRAGFERTNDTWAARKQDLTRLSSSRWAGALTKGTHDQYALARRGQFAYRDKLADGVRMLMHRLSLPVGEKGTKGKPGGYRSQTEWFNKSRRLHILKARLAAVEDDIATGRVHVVRGGKRLARNRHHLAAAQLTEAGWRERWEAARWFLSADGESGKRFGNETIRVTPAGEVSIKLPKPLECLANAPHGRYVLSARVTFPYRGAEWADRITTNRAVAYEIHLDVLRGRWYLTASWKRSAIQAIPLEAARAGGLIGVDTNADHFAAYRLDTHGNPVGNPHQFTYDLTGSADHRDAQLRHALSQLLRWATRTGVTAIAVEDLDFSNGKTREKFGRKKRFRHLIHSIPTAKVKARLVNMAAEHGLTLIAVDAAYTTKWGAEHWKTPLTNSRRAMTRHDAAGIAIGRRALGHPIRRRTKPPRHHQSDGGGHRTVQAEPGTRGREGLRRTRNGTSPQRAATGCAVTAENQRAQDRSGHATEHESWQQDSLPLSS
ncbi:transposase [Streptomyces sp. NBC_01724]|uniref:transposase n=1 Tax=unclassified Streptomyces TaxID=2593676 RepID=UPI002E2EB4F6|nr:transposase [Streptomyces sp. NBC_01724]WTE56347.1 transposase [Streptomyces sp. NBC_01620]